MNALVVYDSRYGNTERIARAIADALREFGEVPIVCINTAHPVELQGVDLLIVGCPTQGWRPTPAIQSLLEKILSEELRGPAVPCFDTRFRLPRWMTGSAAKVMAEKLREMGISLLVPPESFFVKGKEGPLRSGELDRAATRARMLVKEVEALPRTTGGVRTLPLKERIKTRIEHEVDTRSIRLAAGLIRLTKGRVARLWRRQVLLLTTRGRKSGKERTVPLQFFPDGENMIVVAANSGLPSPPGWYFNLTADPLARVEVGDRTLRVRAEELSAEEAAAFWPRVLQAAPDYARYPRRTSRWIPLIRLVPATPTKSVTASRPSAGVSRNTSRQPAEIAPGVYCLRTGRGITESNVYFVRCGSSWVLIDAAWPNRGRLIKESAEAVFGANAYPAAILLTHIHLDHSGSALELARTWGCPVYAHPDELPFAAPGDLSTVEQYANPLDRWVILPLLRAMPRRRVESMLSDTGLKGVTRAFDPDAAVPGLPDWECIPTPGHTPGHVSFFRRSDRVLIAGDALLTVNLNSLRDFVLQKQTVSGPPYISTCNWRAAKDSVAVLAKLEPRVIAGGHGVPMTGPETASNLRAFAGRFSGSGMSEHGEARGAIGRQRG